MRRIFLGCRAGMDRRKRDERGREIHCLCFFLPLLLLPVLKLDVYVGEADSLGVLQLLSPLLQVLLDLGLQLLVRLALE